MTPLLSARGLSKSYPVPGAPWWRRERRFRAVDDVDVELFAGETLGVVGESGCGKSTLARLLLGLLPADAGSVLIDGRETLRLAEPDWRRLRRTVQLVYQDAAGALDPRLSVGDQVAEPLRIHGSSPTAAADMLAAVGLDASFAGRRPHELSGGQLQRVVIARALVLEPRLLVLDEPVSALDVSVQAAIVTLLKRLQRERQLAYLFVSHDLAVVRQMSDRIAVMYLGRVIEIAPVASFHDEPLHPYAQALLAAVPVPDPDVGLPRTRLTGEPPDAAAPPSGCRFHPRCPVADERCRRESPALRPIGGRHDGRQVACHRVSI